MYSNTGKMGSLVIHPSVDMKMNFALSQRRVAFVCVCNVKSINKCVWFCLVAYILVGALLLAAVAGFLILNKWQQ